VRVLKLPRERDYEGAGSQARSTLPSDSVKEARIEARRVGEHNVCGTPRDILQTWQESEVGAVAVAQSKGTHLIEE